MTGTLRFAHPTGGGGAGSRLGRRETPTRRNPPGAASGATLSPSHPLTLSPAHPLTPQICENASGRRITSVMLETVSAKYGSPASRRHSGSVWKVCQAASRVAMSGNVSM